MTAATLRALAARCMEAGAGDRELDAEIALATGWLMIRPNWFRPKSVDVHHHISELPRFTASLDAAMSLARTDAEACAILQEAIDTLSRDCSNEGDWRARLPKHVTAAALLARAAVMEDV